MALVCGFHALTNSTKNSILGVMGILDPPLEYTKVI